MHISLYKRSKKIIEETITSEKELLNVLSIQYKFKKINSTLLEYIESNTETPCLMSYNKFMLFIRAYQKSNSTLSELWWTRRGYTLNEAKENISEKQKLNSSKLDRSNSNCIQVSYWMKRKNLTEIEAKAKVSEIQKSRTNFNVDNWIGRGLSESDAKSKVYKIQKANSDKVDYSRDDRTATQINYWIKKGYSESEAKIKLKEHQSTFSLEICIEKYGEIEGRKRFNKRQEQWLKSLDTPENQEKLKNGRSLGGINACMGEKNFINFSKISQELFWSIYNEIKNKFNKIYFAENGNNHNDEYKIFFKSNQHKKHLALLDFYVKDINKCIEFDGDYWHGEARGNQESDRIREELIKENCDGIQILHIKERDYNKDKEKVVRECLNFINN